MRDYGMDVYFIIGLWDRTSIYIYVGFSGRIDE